MIEIVSEYGFGAVTVRELVRLAGVSTHTFYEHFQGKEECFLSTHELLVRRSTGRVFAAQRGCRDWQQRLRLAFRAFAGGVAREPAAALLALVEAFAAGPSARRQVLRAEGAFEAMIAKSFGDAPDGVAVPALIVKGVVAGAARVTRARLVAGRERELPALAEELLEWALCYRCRVAAALAELEAAVVPSRPGFLLVGGGGQAGRVDRLGTDERTRILTAVARLAAEQGYRRLTLPRIRAAAGVSRKRFDAHFEDVHGCFFAAVELLSERALAYAACEGAGGRDWPGAVHRALCALCACFAADPLFARLAFVEVFAPGPDGVRCRAGVITGVAARLHESAPAAQRPSELAAEASVGAICGVVHHHVATGNAHRLPQVTPTLSFLALAPAIGAQQALEAITAEQARMRADGARRLAASAH